jgi:hypothetical protein
MEGLSEVYVITTVDGDAVHAPVANLRGRFDGCRCSMSKHQGKTNVRAVSIYL